MPICPACNKEFKPSHYYPSQRFCSRKCQCHHNAIKGKNILCICKYCGKKYHPKQISYNKYCSRECRFNYLHERKAKREQAIELAKQNKPIPVRTCHICGITFQSNTNANYCSGKCRKEKARIKALEYDKKKFIPKTFNCKQCGKSVTTQYGDKLDTFCSKKCNKKYTKRLIERNHRKRARKYGCEYKPVRPVKIFERDNWHCRICGRPTTKKLRGTIKPNAPELDHIIPLSLGGSHTEINLQCACRECNINKSNKAKAQMFLFA
jgi:hypothetical protein